MATCVTQRAFGELVGITQQTVSDLVRRGVLIEGETAGEWLLAYCDHLREVAAGRGGADGVVNLVAERARLARAQALKVEMHNAERRGLLAPTALLEQVLASAGSRAWRIFGTIKGEIRRRVPQLTAADLAAVDAIVNKAMQQVADLSLQLDSSAADEDNETGDRAHPSEGHEHD